MGSFARVYRARDTIMDRDVAIKVPLPSTFQSAEALTRFLREAKATGQLSHPNIVTTYEVGVEGEQIYLASELIRGQTLADGIAAAQIDPRSAAELAERLSDALSYAHLQGIVHRDIKPDNILLDTNRQPHILDFGLARLQADREKLTHDGAVMGTPVYMSPEQAGGEKKHPVGPQSDQYSLGVVLYEMLTGAPPFRGSVEAVIFNVIATDPPAPHTVRAGIPRDLDTICQKAMAKEPEARYANCDAMREDLRRWRDGEPILGRRVGIAERLVRWARRKPLLAGMVSALAATLLIGFSVSGVLAFIANQKAIEANRQRQKADAESREANRQRFLADRRNYGSTMLLCDQAWGIQDGEFLSQLLESQLPGPTTPVDWRHFEWYYYWQRLNQADVAGVERSAPEGRLLAYSSTTGYMATHAARQEVHVLEGSSGERIASLKLPLADSRVGLVEFGPEGKILATHTHHGVIDVWDVLGEELLFSYKSHGEDNQSASQMLTSLQISADGTYVASLGLGDGFSNNRVVIRDVATQSKHDLLTGFQGNGMTQIVFGPDSSEILAYQRSIVRAFNIETGIQGNEIELGGEISRLAVSPNGDFLMAIVGAELQMLSPAWDVLRTWPIPETSHGADLQISQDNKRVALASQSNALVFELSSDEPQRFLHASDQVDIVGFDPDRPRLLTQGLTVREWKLDGDAEADFVQEIDSETHRVEFTSDGKWLVTLGNSSVAFRDAETLKVKFHVDGVWMGRYSISPDGDHVAIVKSDGFSRTECQIWSLDEQIPIKTIRFPGDDLPNVRTPDFSPDGRTLAWSSNRKVYFFDWRKGKQIDDWDASVGALKYSHDGEYLLTNDGTFQVRTGEQLHNRGIELYESSIAVAPDDNIQVSIGKLGIIDGLIVSKIATGKVLASLIGFSQGESVNVVRFSPDGKRLITGTSYIGAAREDWGSSIKIWDTVTWRPLMTIDVPQASVGSVSMSSDGRRLAVATFSRSEEAVVWKGSVHLAMPGEEVSLK